jgi:RNA polymerase sigma-70 factor (ECF subfamily)
MFSTPGTLPRLRFAGEDGGDGRDLRDGFSDPGQVAMSGFSSPKRHPLDPDDLLTPEDEVAMRDQWRATEALYRDEAPHLARYFERRVPAADVFDFVQESFRRVLGHTPERPGAFLGRTAANLVIEFRRAAMRRRAHLHEPFDERQLGGVDPIPQLEARDALGRVDAALRQMKPKTRDIFLMSRIEGKSYAEIGVILGMSEDGVRKQVSKAIHVLRRRVGDL